MLCERCKNSEATFHITEITNYVQKELHLCTRCLNEIKIDTQLKYNVMSLKGIFPFEDVENIKTGSKNVVCLNCGLTDVELSLERRPGCPNCYRYFKSALYPLSGSGNARKYSGKRPLNYIEVMSFPNDAAVLNNSNVGTPETKAELKEALRIAVEEERYEDAAVFRDKIKEVGSIE